MENWFVPDTPTPLPEVAQVLVLAPHADDEVLGCGGLLAQLAQRGAQIQVLLLTDSGGYFSGQERLDYAQRRLEESRAAASVIGIASVRALDIHDRHLGHTPKALMEIVQAIQQARPELLLAPAPSEIHPDHTAASRLALTALDWAAQHALPTPELWQYEVGQPLQPNCLIDITPVVEIKRKAMQCFPSQIEQQDYVQHILALNTYRTYSLPAHLGVRWAEAYRRYKVTEVQQLLQHPGPDHHLGLLSRMAHALEVAQAQSEAQAAHLRDLMSIPQLSKLVDLAQGLARWEQVAKDHHAFGERLEAIHKHLLADPASLTSNQAMVDRLEKLHQQLLDERDSMLKSRSWRVTAPFRWLEQRIRKLRKRR